MNLTILSVFGAVISGEGQPATDGIAMAKRFNSAISGQSEFHDADFVRPLDAAEKAALRRFGQCKVDDVSYRWMPDPVEEDTYIRNRNQVLVTYGCPGVPQTTPAGITLHLKNGRIGTLETHNADLLGGR